MQMADTELPKHSVRKIHSFTFYKCLYFNFEFDLRSYTKPKQGDFPHFLNMHYIITSCLPSRVKTVNRQCKLSVYFLPSV